MPREGAASNCSRSLLEPFDTTFGFSGPVLGMAPMPAVPNSDAPSSMPKMLSDIPGHHHRS